MTSTTRNKDILLKNKAVKLVLPLIVIFAIWEISAIAINESIILPTVEETILSLFKTVTGKSFLRIVAIAFLRVAAGIISGVLLGIILATLCHYFTLADTLITPIISIMKATPVACMIILLWISMSYTEIAVFVVVLMVMPIIWQNILDGYRSINKELDEVATVYNFSIAKRIKLLIIPSLFNYLKPALVTSIGLAWKAEIAAEIVTYNNIGQLIYYYKNSPPIETAPIFAWTIIIVTFSILLERLTKMLMGRLEK